MKPRARAGPFSIAPTYGPKARYTWPVSVATETRTEVAGSAPSLSAASRSASTRRPSASVFPIRTRTPERAVMISSETNDSSPTLLRTMPSSATTRRPGTFRSASARTSPTTVAAPPLSRDMPAMPPFVFTSAPPVSYVTPLPASSTVRVTGPSGTSSSDTTHGWCRSTCIDARATAASSG